MNSQAMGFQFPAEAGGGGGEARDALSAGDVLRAVMRHKLLIGAVFTVMTGAAAALSVYLPPVYTATASIIIDDDGSRTVTDSTAGATAAGNEVLVNGQIQQLRSRALADRVATMLGLANDAEFNPARGPAKPAKATSPPVAAPAVVTEAVVDRVKGHVAVARVSQSNIITIEASSHDPEQAARIANGYAIAHIGLQRDYALALNHRAVAQLQPQVDALRNRVIAADKVVAGYRRANDIVGEAEGTDIVMLSRLAGSLSDAQSNVTEAAARAAANVAAPSSAEGGGAMAESAQLSALRQQGMEISKRVTELSSFYGANYPDLVNARAQLADITRRIAEESRAVSGNLAAQVRINQARVGQIGGDVAAVTAKSYRRHRASVKLMDLERSAEAERLLYVASLTRLQELQTGAQLIAPSARVLARAVAPLEASFPRTRQIVGTVAAGSLLLGLLAAFIVEMADNRVRNSGWVTRLVGLPTLAMVPKLSADEIAKAHRVLKTDPASVFAESLRNLYLETSRRMPQESGRTVLVTSPLPGDGKTTIALGLGAAAATMWQRTVVIDMDLRRPGLLEAAGFAPEATKGRDLLAYLAGSAGLNDIIFQDSEMPALNFIFVSGIVKDPAALLASPRIGSLLTALRDGFDFIVMTAPPVLAVSDAKQLTNVSDATLLVLRWGETRAAVLQDAVKLFERPLVGTVINQVDIRRHVRHGYGDPMQHHYACSSYYGPITMDNGR